MASSLDIWNTVIGVLGLLSLIGQLLFWIVNSRLPSTRLRILEHTLERTQCFLDSCVEEGRLNDSNDAEHFQRTLCHLRIQTNDLKIQTGGEETLSDDLRNMWRGLSRNVEDLYQEVRRTRASISTSSSSSVPLLRAQDAMDTGTASLTPTVVTPSGPTAPHEVKLTISQEMVVGPSSLRENDDTTPVQDAKTPDNSTQPLLVRDRRMSASSQTSCTPSLRRRKQGSAMARARALARSARLACA
ncbi:hypothetical protein C8Q79DRAFT_746317 [Trametes meyenii]|nr:hypothetical protein C8Q79DRAFT_746317 [Trametes meyenii]